MRRCQLLTPTQRERVTRWPASDEALNRYYQLSQNDIALIRRRRRPLNRLGFAPHLCCLRFSGRTWLSGEVVPPGVLSFVCEQLGIEPTELTRYTSQRVQIHYEHMAEAQRMLGLSPFTFGRYRDTSRRLLPLAMDDERPMHLVNATIADLRRQRISIPRITVIERLCFEVRGRARVRVYRELTGTASPSVAIGSPATSASTEESVSVLLAPPSPSLEQAVSVVASINAGRVAGRVRIEFLSWS